LHVAYFVPVLCADPGLPAAAFADNVRGLDDIYAAHFGARVAVGMAVSANPAFPELFANILAAVPAAALIKQLQYSAPVVLGSRAAQW
jgi:hypothetical protein